MGLKCIQSKARGEKHPRWRGGRTLTKKGYVRITAGKERGKYEHRVVAEAAWRETHGEDLPPGTEVHHIDFCKWHNCRSNLLILPEEMHAAFQREHPKADNGTYARRAAYDDVPDWVLQDTV